jgi:ferredoxin
VQVAIDAAKCQGHGMCNMVCPRVFVYDSDGFGRVVPELANVPAELEADVRLAEIQCPERAIVIKETQACRTPTT